jgi:hypothetical protein
MAVKFAEFPQRTCRQITSDDGLIDHACLLPELHPGPCCPNTRAAIARREAWEAAHPGWEKLAQADDPFAEFKP